MSSITFRQPFKGEYPITQSYGEKITSAFHTGIDYGCPVGTEILASAGGTVMFAGWDSTGYGLCVIIRHQTDKATLYAHLRKIYVGTLEKVTQGQPVGLSGDSGNVTGPHLHFEARYKWDDYKSYFDPMQLPLMSVDDAPSKPVQQKLKDAAELNEEVYISAPMGAWGWNRDFSRRATVYPQGTPLHYTGRTVVRNGYTYCEVYPDPITYWVAVHDGDTQILDNREDPE